MTNALILAAGFGTRLAPLTDLCPKPMLKIGNEPLLEHTINLLKTHGIKNILINLHHQGHVIEEYFGNGSQLDIHLSYSKEEKLLGTAGTLKNVENFLDDTFVVIYGDVFSLTDITQMLAYHEMHNGIATVGLYRVPDPERCGIVNLADDNQIIKFVEKPAKGQIYSNLANAGIYILNKAILEYIPSCLNYDFGHDVFPAILKKHIPIYGYLIKDYLVDIGTPSNYERVNQEYEKGQCDL
ncbi:MAG: nucleotidyltransferase family protein [Pseudomonadota bacterium]